MSSIVQKTLCATGDAGRASRPSSPQLHRGRGAEKAVSTVRTIATEVVLVLQLPRGLNPEYELERVVLKHGHSLVCSSRPWFHNSYSVSQRAQLESAAPTLRACRPRVLVSLLSQQPRALHLLALAPLSLRMPLLPLEAEKSRDWMPDPAPAWSSSIALLLLLVRHNLDTKTTSRCATNAAKMTRSTRRWLLVLRCALPPLMGALRQPERTTGCASPAAVAKLAGLNGALSSLVDLYLADANPTTFVALLLMQAASRT